MSWARQRRLDSYYLSFFLLFVFFFFGHVSLDRLGYKLLCNSHEVRAFEKKEVGWAVSVPESRHRQAAGENKEPAANLIIISHLFTDLMHPPPLPHLAPPRWSLSLSAVPRLPPHHLPGIRPLTQRGLWWNPFRAECGGLKCHFSIQYLRHKARHIIRYAQLH